MLSLYRRLIAIRRASEALSVGDYRLEDGTDDGCLAYVRSAGEERKLVALNLTGDSAAVRFGGHGTVLLSTALDRDAVPVEGVASLRPNEGVIIDLATEGS
jgi:alpha-glucosidase